MHVFHVDTLQEFSYNEHGGVVRSVLRHADAQTPQIVSGTAYQHNGNHILSQTDARGKTVTHDIDENTDLTRAVTDSNGQQVQYAYDSAPRYEYAYNARGGVAWVRNNRLNTIARSDYDFGGRPRSMVTQDASGANVYTARVDYDTCGRLARFAEQVGASRAAYETTFGYDREDRPTALTYGSSASKTETAYDGLGRLSTRKVYVNGSAYTTAYAYAPGAESGQTTALVQEITQPGENHSYAYDNVGNIVSAARNGVTTTYAYDALGQLIRVNDPSDGTWTYEYDCGGNILNKKQYAYTTGTLGTVQQIVSYAYGDADWKDKLTRYNGVDIAYDAIGNPIQDGVWTYTWENGRQLRRMACDATIAEFVYNADGLRVQKTVNGVATNYTLHGKNIVHMTKGNAELHFWYDAQNRPAIVEFNGTKYGYLYNLQGDVIGLIDSANTEVVKYTYDAWGKPLSVTGSLANTIGYYNPFRYRGYVYDVETGLYYLRSRYYNPSWGRFVNADEILGRRGFVMSHNVFIYCYNQPVSCCDEDGRECRECQDGNGNIAYSVYMIRGLFVEFYESLRGIYPIEPVQGLGKQLISNITSSGADEIASGVLDKLGSKLQVSGLPILMTAKDAYNDTVKTMIEFDSQCGMSLANYLSHYYTLSDKDRRFAFVRIDVYSNIQANKLTFSYCRSDGSVINQYSVVDADLWDNMSTRTFARVTDILEKCYGALNNHYHPYNP